MSLKKMYAGRAQCPFAPDVCVRTELSPINFSESIWPLRPKAQHFRIVALSPGRRYAIR
jgi:hypothetical protein